MIRINMKSLGSEHEFARLMEGFGDELPEHGHAVVGLSDGRGRECSVRVGSDFVQINFEGHGSVVTIQRPDAGSTGIVPARLNWSSSSTGASAEDAIATGKLLVWASAVAERLTTWANDGELPRLKAVS